MNERFIQYFREQFFLDDPDTLQRFLGSLTKSLPKTFRVNTNRITIARFREVFEREFAPLETTDNPRAFYIPWGDDRRIILGNTWLHLLGYMYIQELSASLAVEILTDGHTDDRELSILDMAGSPGGKTTQLAEYYPNSRIIGNEPDRDRMEAYILNVERMGCDNVALCNYPGAFFGNFPETFDRVLLDAPCSGEGICYKSHEAQAYWNMKNVTRIAHVQSRLLDAAIRTLKIGGEMVYSTCTLNRIENEDVLDSAKRRYGDAIDIVFVKRFWPHETAGGGFFVARIVKRDTVATKTTTRDTIPNRKLRLPLYREERYFTNFVSETGLVIPEGRIALHDHTSLRYMRGDSDISDLIDSWYFVRFGKCMGTLDHEVFTPDSSLGRDYSMMNVPRYPMIRESLDDYFRGLPYTLPEGIAIENSTYAILEYQGFSIGLSTLDHGSRIMANTFPMGWRRKG